MKAAEARKLHDATNTLEAALERIHAQIARDASAGWHSSWINPDYLPGHGKHTNAVAEYLHSEGYEVSIGSQMGKCDVLTVRW